MSVILEWNTIDTVLLDMDGTLLDLHFDNYFWQTHLPQRYAEIHGVELQSAMAQLEQQVKQYEGKLQWYCLDFWSKALDLDIRLLKEEVMHKIAVRPQVKEFLSALREAGKRVVLITNAHPLSLELKLEVTELDSWLDIVISSHEFNTPKEDQKFWHELQMRESFDPARTLFVDDTLRILDSAREYGIAHVLAIHQPDSQQERIVEGYPAIYHFDEVLPVIDATDC